MTRGANTGLGIDWNFDSFEGLINNRGELVIHQVGSRCVCNLEDTYLGQMEQSASGIGRRRPILCDRCDGVGFIFRKPNKIVALITGIREDKTLIESGWVLPGDCVLSSKPNYLISEDDLITYLWPQPVSGGQVVVRGAATMGENAERTTNLGVNEDRLWYNAVDSIWCEDEDGAVYQNGVDFVLNGSKVIEWKNTSLIAGKKYTIKYSAYLEWVAFTPPNIRRDRDRDIGSRVLLRKRHVALINESTIRVNPLDRIPFCQRVSEIK